jgi:two-component system nitrogen regulation sensor histidine kinase GlnL
MVFMTPRPEMSQPTAALVVDSLATAIVYMDTAQTIRYLNPAAESLLRISARQVANSSLSEMLPFSVGLAERINSVINSNESYREWEYLLALTPSKSIAVDYSVSLVNEGAGVLLELLPVDQQMEAHQQEKRLEQQTLSQEVIRGLAHEIKNPLGGLRGAAQLLERELSDPDLKEFTNIITREADRLTSLVDQLLGPTRLPKDEPLNVHEVTEHVLQLVGIEIQNQSVEISRDYDPSIPDLLADREQLIQALLNVVQNAVQALDGNGEILIRTRAQRQVNINGKRKKLVARIDVIDNGPGVPESMQEKVFYPMVTGRAEGTGLGLAIARSMCVRTGGTVLLESEPGRTCFSLLLPIRNN